MVRGVRRAPGQVVKLPVALPVQASAQAATLSKRLGSSQSYQRRGRSLGLARHTEFRLAEDEWAEGEREGDLTQGEALTGEVAPTLLKSIVGCRFESCRRGALGQPPSHPPPRPQLTGFVHSVILL